MKRQKNNNFKMLIFIVIIFLALLFICYKSTKEFFRFFLHDNLNSSSISSYSSNKYETIKLDNNSNYLGIGQKKVSGCDGYFTTFTDLNNKTFKEYKQNGTSSWANKNYWDGKMEDTGCGITAMSIILSGYGLDYTPEDLRQKYYPVLNGDRISSELSNTFNIPNSDFYYDDVRLSEKNITEHLKENKPVLICVWNKPEENRWTTASHYMVLLACDSNSMVYISNPNGLENNSKSSGWYNFKEVLPYIAKALYINK